MLAGPLEGPSGLRCFGPNALFTHHVINALPFSKSIRVTLEHGTENDKSNDYASTAYWYQTLPTKPFPDLPGREIHSLDLVGEDGEDLGAAAGPQSAAD